jgi:hypothetical protein
MASSFDFQLSIFGIRTPEAIERDSSCRTSLAALRQQSWTEQSLPTALKVHNAVKWFSLEGSVPPARM